MAASLMRTLVAVSLLLIGASANGLELLPDPTKPAVDTTPLSTAGAGGASASMAAASGTGAAGSQAMAKEGLQSVIISAQHRAAVINGVTVELGQKVGDAKLIEVREKSVVLQGPQGKRVMELFPGVHMKKTEFAAQSVQKSAPVQPTKAHAVKTKKVSEPTGAEQIKDERGSK